MKVTHNWLKRYVDCDSTPDELAEQLTMIGLEVEGAENVSGALTASWSQRCSPRSRTRTPIACHSAR
ncbi:MAG: hypothetical protein CM1200mP29_07440 [Verrucomicrobiota bacterium]|nr:MAG: hypothetical protein CM1200mP29_07440 [Verrucomicrobiota bacterium]